MKTIEKEVISEWIIQKSRFITILTPIQKEEEIKNTLLRIKETYKGATHYCYAYHLEGKMRFDDDAEPSKTAGMPILNVLQKEELDHILCVVVRYFGGIKLGAGGLVRSYTKSVTNALEKATFHTLEKKRKVLLTFPYEQEKKVSFLLKDKKIEEKKYEKEITYILWLKEEELKTLDSANIFYEKKEQAFR